MKYKLTLILLLLTIPLGASQQLEQVSTDPAFPSAGMDVTIATTIYEEGTREDRGRYSARLEPSNRLVEQHVRILDDETVTLGYLTTGTSFVTKHDVKILPSAPTGTYAFDLILTDMKTGAKITKPVRIDVEQEGVDIDATLIETSPRQLRPGDTTSQATIRITNTGNVPVEDITIRPSFSENITPLYSEDEKIRIASLNVKDYQDITVGFDVSKDVSEGRHVSTLLTTYEDDESNQFEEAFTIPLRVEGRPILTIDETIKTMQGGETKKLRVTVRNKGSQDAENVEARLLLQEGQPFTPLDRSTYIGRISPGENKTASFTVEAAQNSEEQEHNVEVELRATGDRQEGDRNVYIERKSITVDITGQKTSILLPLGASVLAILLAIVVFITLRKEKEVKE